MSKTKSAFFCQTCGYETPKWLGKCPGCGEWNTLVEEVKIKKYTDLINIKYHTVELKNWISEIINQD